ncbi:hypothetical protein [Melittangium boletus]|uniref:hypothetical protein n=1 Tax=Melittangium boletus TaxID=83453 RepID=UPI003DA64D96
MRGEGTGSTNGWNKVRRTWALGAMFAGGLAAPALAQPSVGDVLGDGTAYNQTHKRLDCRGDFCLWHVITNLGSCSNPRCENHTFCVSDRQGRYLGNEDPGVPVDRSTVEVRFIGPRRFELLNDPTRRLMTDDGRRVPGYIPEDTGMDEVAGAHRERWTLSADGKTLTQEKGPPTPAWKREPLPVPAPPKRPPANTTPRLQRPVPKAVLAQALKACDDATRWSPLHHECHGDTCVLILDSDPDRHGEGCGGSLCPLLVQGGRVRPLALSGMVNGPANHLDLTPTEYTFTACDGVRGSWGTVQSLSRLRPAHMNFTPTEGRHVEGADPYPVREAKSVEAARALAPTVHAYTHLHIPWGREAWRDEKDLALAWQLSRVGDTLHLHAEVDDDVVVPFTSGTGLHSDHLELTLWGGSSQEAQLGVLLAPEGRLLVRRWREQEGGKSKAVEVDLPEATGSWSQGAHGYALDLTLPLALVRGPVPSFFAPWLLLVSDADTAGKQETLMGHGGTLYFWSEYPPTIDEYQRVHPRN